MIEFLGSGGTGVISFARGNEPYAIPVSYGFDPDGPAFYIRMGYPPESEKQSFAEASDGVSIVVYRETPEGWKSVVATGSFDEVTEASIDSSVVDAVRSVDIPFVDVYDRHPRDVRFTLNRVVVDRMTGRKEPTG
jgi:nitroimidazol reductase NimA-like FMN-containing flavoprotein (pyridoxamine 5'-phosphate oxidase superfamily)